MTVQPQEVPPGLRRPQPPAIDWRRDPGFTWPQRRPWSELGPDFIDAWGRSDPSDPQPEGVEIVGQTGSGKSYLMCTCLQDRMIARKTGAVIICTKRADRVFHKLGWPVVDTWDEVRQHANCLFWPQTSRTGIARKQYHEAKISDLLNRLWQPDANAIVAFDEIGYVESLSAEMRAMVQMYWREARSVGITVVGMKQRPQGALRDMHSETYWTMAFKPKDRADLERWAELFGSRRDWMPVFDSLSRERREFIIANPVHDEAFISWVDTPLAPVKPPGKQPPWWRR